MKFGGIDKCYEQYTMFVNILYRSNELILSRGKNIFPQNKPKNKSVLVEVYNCGHVGSRNSYSIHYDHSLYANVLFQIAIKRNYYNGQKGLLNIYVKCRRSFSK